MITFPRGVTARTAFRVELDQRASHGVVLAAARLAAMSERCRNGYHWTELSGGCPDSGATCLCACHDKADTNG